LARYRSVLKSETLKNKLTALLLLPTMLLSFAACSQSDVKKTGNTNATKKTANAKMANYTEGKDYFLLKRFRVIDPNGFGYPVEAASFLLPSTWQVQGGVKWNTVKCLSDIVQASVQANSPDNSYAFYAMPTTQFDWVNNEQMLYALRTGGFGMGCNIAQPLTAAGYLQQAMPKLVNATCVGANAIAGMEQQLKQQFAQYAAGGMAMVPSVAEGKFQFADGAEGIGLCYIIQIIQNIPGYDGSNITHTQTAVYSRMFLKYPKGQEQQARSILSGIVSSFRVNTVWYNAIQQMFNNIRQNVQSETWKRIQKISNGIVRSWESRNESADKSANMFSQYIRGVDSWKDGSGNTVELSSGYSNAWQKADGSYLLSNDVSFDPNVAFKESWSKLSK
jgi:hypothetical protein